MLNTVEQLPGDMQLQSRVVTCFTEEQPEANSHREAAVRGGVLPPVRGPFRDTTQNVQWPLWPTKKLMESQVGFAMPGIGFAGPGALFGKAAQIGRFFFLPQKTRGTDKICRWCRHK